MTNHLRGEISAMLDGTPTTLCLTLGALAKLEAVFGCGDLIALVERLQSGRVKADDLIDILHAGLSGAGDKRSREEVAGIKIEGGVEGAVAIIAELFEATFPKPDKRYQNGE
jgi:hypothetical protein